MHGGALRKPRAHGGERRRRSLRRAAGAGAARRSASPMASSSPASAAPASSPWARCSAWRRISRARGCTVLDFTGLAQKNGAVMSHIRLAPKPEDIHAVRIAAGGADLLLGCDMVVAASPEALTRIETGVTRAVVNSYLAPTAAFVMNGDVDFEDARDAPRAPQRHGRARHRVRRRQRPRDRADGRCDRQQPLHARLCLAAGAGAALARGDRARDRAQRRRASR